MNNPVAAAVSNAGYQLIDADTHLTEPHDLWVSRAPAKYRDRVPQVKEIDGVRSWVFDGDKVIGRGAPPASAIRRDGTKVRSFDEFRQLSLEEVHLGSWRMEERLEFMDQHGIWAQIVYPNILGFGGGLTTLLDPEVREISIQIFNDAMAELQEASGGRICPMALLPWWDPRKAVAETRRALDLGLKGININPTPYLHKDSSGNPLPDLGDGFWDPLWDICSGARVPINFHIGSSEETLNWLGTQGWPSLTIDRKWAVGGTNLFFENSQTLCNLIISGLLDRFEDLQFVSVESGIGWIPYVLEALDYQYHETAAATGLNRLPSEYFASNFHGCFWFEKHNICESIKALGVNNCMFQTDFPHPTCLYPIDDIQTRLAELNAQERYRVMFGNCAELYAIDLPSGE